MMRAAFGPGAGCVPLEQLGALHDGVLPESEAAPLRAHLADCPHCRTELAMLTEFTNAAPTPDEAADVAWIAAQLEKRSPVQPVVAVRPTVLQRLSAWFAPGPGRLAWGAALMVLLSAGVYLQQSRAPGRPEFHGETGVLRSGTVTVGGPVGEQAQLPVEFRWDAVAGAASYRVRLLGVDRAELWAGTSASPVLAIPRGLVVSGQAYAWEVAALDGGGKALAQSGLHNFHILATSR
jgi:hypothetical protein